MTDTLAPVERTNWALLAWNSTLDRNDVSSAWLYGQDHLWATAWSPRVFTWGGGVSSTLPSSLPTSLPTPLPSPPLLGLLHKAALWLMALWLYLWPYGLTAPTRFRFLDEPMFCFSTLNANTNPNPNPNCRPGHRPWPLTPWQSLPGRRPWLLTPW